MEQALRVILWFGFAALALTLIASGALWWFENTRRLARGVTTALGHAPDALVFDTRNTKAAGLDFSHGDLAILWDIGRHGLVFTFDEIEGAELIVDERVVARTQKGEPRRVLEETYPNASRVVLRLIFADVQTPEFELTLFGDVTTNNVHPKTATEAVQLGRKWLSHVDAVIKRVPPKPASQPRAVPQPSPDEA
ncbi:hypothetical protein [Asticcacaulis sp. YBE204]|uniref:hypothetical protein n=1 Tax=Asticcacaulis sp. YBE204 TaxID=1282363 RepID=UPI0003C3C8DD|nr:hypothetical protein [Asticcacaulis sp. YBE204]ESQ80589.1 hypothetical protein AEYBE204_04785 [Asticcacaulis sp. YBE204]